MPPKFQSSFIPKGTIASAGSMPAAGKKVLRRDFLSFLAVLIFAISVAAAAGTFLYKLYLNYDIAKMGKELESARATLSPEVIRELIRLDARIDSTGALLKNHTALSPVFDFLEKATPQNVRYIEFNFSSNDKGMTIILKGEARSYSTLAQAADLVNKSPYFKNPVFSDLNLDERGNVVFSLKANVEKELLSYQKLVESTPPLPLEQATSTGRTATTTRSN